MSPNWITEHLRDLLSMMVLASVIPPLFAVDVFSESQSNVDPLSVSAAIQADADNVDGVVICRIQRRNRLNTVNGISGHNFIAESNRAIGNTRNNASVTKNVNVGI